MRFNKLCTSLYNGSISCAYLCSHRSRYLIIYTIAVHFIHIHDLFVSLRPFTILLILVFVFPQAAPHFVDEIKRGIEAVKSKLSEYTVSPSESSTTSVPSPRCV